VFVLDEDAAVRESLALLVVGEGWRCETFASAQQFFKRPAALAPNCLVLDAFSCPNALDVQRRIAFDHPDTSVIFLTGSIDIATTVKAMKAGAVEFFTKPFRDDLLLAAIREALQCSRIALGHEAGMQELRDRYATLTAREQQVMVLVVSGLLNKCIAGELGISEITVKAHRGQVMQKMKANSLADLVKMALKLQVTDLP
jgi:FixJ family two-component response regulator